jgi:hypothetical protein
MGSLAQLLLEGYNTYVAEYKCDVVTLKIVVL